MTYTHNITNFKAEKLISDCLKQFNFISPIHTHACSLSHTHRCTHTCLHTHYCSVL